MTNMDGRTATGINQKITPTGLVKKLDKLISCLKDLSQSMTRTNENMVGLDEDINQFYQICARLYAKFPPYSPSPVGR